MLRVFQLTNLRVSLLLGVQLNDKVLFDGQVDVISCGSRSDLCLCFIHVILKPLGCRTECVRLNVSLDLLYTAAALLESRLDNVVYRLGFAMSRAEARQMVSHGHITINGRKVNIPSYQVKPGMIVALKDSSRGIEKIKANIEPNSFRPAPKWLEYDANKAEAKVVAVPARDDIDLPIEEHLIVELYSK